MEKGMLMVGTPMMGTWFRKKDAIPLPVVLGLEPYKWDDQKQDQYFFSWPLLNQRLAILKNMVNGRSFLVVVWGERGSGKTTLMNHFVETADKGWRSCRIRLKPDKTAAVNTWRNLHNRMVFISQKGDLPSVIIDDAHQLSPAELKLIMRTAFPPSGERKIKSVVLFAEPRIRERFVEMANMLPGNAVIDKFSMAPLTEKQTADYLSHRIRTAGFLTKTPLSREQIRKIHRTSGGLPGWINGEAYMAMRRLFGGHYCSQLPFSPLRQILQLWCSRLLASPRLYYRRAMG